MKQDEKSSSTGDDWDFLFVNMADAWITQAAVR
jgi:hypothetical protein